MLASLAAECPELKVLLREVENWHHEESPRKALNKSEVQWQHEISAF